MVSYIDPTTMEALDGPQACSVFDEDDLVDIMLLPSTNNLDDSLKCMSLVENAMDYDNLEGYGTSHPNLADSSLSLLTDANLPADVTMEQPPRARVVSMYASSDKAVFTGCFSSQEAAPTQQWAREAAGHGNAFQFVQNNQLGNCVSQKVQSSKARSLAAVIQTIDHARRLTLSQAHQLPPLSTDQHLSEITSHSSHSDCSSTSTSSHTSTSNFTSFPPSMKTSNTAGFQHPPHQPSYRPQSTFMASPNTNTLEKCSPKPLSILSTTASWSSLAVEPVQRKEHCQNSASLTTSSLSSTAYVHPLQNEANNKSSLDRVSQAFRSSLEQWAFEMEPRLFDESHHHSLGKHESAQSQVRVGQACPTTLEPAKVMEADHISSSAAGRFQEPILQNMLGELNRQGTSSHNNPAWSMRDNHPSPKIESPQHMPLPITEAPSKEFIVASSILLTDLTPKKVNRRKKHTVIHDKDKEDRPKRPLTAYNLYFRDERARLLAEHQAQTHQAACNEVDDEPHTSATTKRQRRMSPHGKITFEAMARLISKGWKEIDSERLAQYKRQAEANKVRYREQVEKFAQKKKAVKA